MKHLAFVYVALSAGCILPISTGAPMPATTVGKGNVGFAISGEVPTLDLIADQDNKNLNSNDPIAYGAAPAAATTLSFSYGLGEDTDLEIAGEGALYYFILPAPTGGSIGLRQHFDGGDSIDFAIAARVGHVGSTAESTDSSGNTDSSGARANYGAFQAVVQTKHGLIRPLAALNFMPAHIRRDPYGANNDFSFNGMASSVTLGLMFVGSRAVFGPYATATNFYSDRFDNSGWFVSGGLMLALRPDRNRPKVVYPDNPPPGGYYGPVPGYGPQAPPPQAPPPQAPPPPPGPAQPPPTAPI
ncbi:MAG TPA: hypothetical protein VLB44_14625 [Kofleriaceae bacterium]|nr:hypothetical protein [Kofleriaceae bacterium]